MARLPTIILNCFKFTLCQGNFNQVACFSSLNPSLDTHMVTGLFLQLCHASGTLYHLILDLVFVPQNSNLFSKLILCHRFTRTNFVVSVFSFVLFLFYCTLNTQWICSHYKPFVIIIINDLLFLSCRCLGNFVQLVDKILLCHLLSLARTNICQFVNNTMAAGSNAKRDALFAAKLIFNDNSKFPIELKGTRCLGTVELVFEKRL